MTPAPARASSHGVPVRPFGDVARHAGSAFRPFTRPSSHGVCGIPGSGKSHLVRHGLLAALGPYTAGVIIDLKPGGDRVWRGFGNHIGPAELPCPLTLGDASTGRGMWHVSAPEGLTRATVAPLLEQLAAERSAVAVLDDATTITDSAGDRGGMGLDGLVDRLLREGRAHGLSVILGFNSPTWAGRGGSKTLCGTYWIGYTPGREGRAGFADMAGLPAEHRGALEPPAAGLRRWLYSTIDETTGTRVLAVTTAPSGNS